VRSSSFFPAADDDAFNDLVEADADLDNDEDDVTAARFVFTGSKQVNSCIRRPPAKLELFSMNALAIKDLQMKIVAIAFRNSLGTEVGVKIRLIPPDHLQLLAILSSFIIYDLVWYCVLLVYSVSYE